MLTPTHNQAEYSVSELAGALKKTVEERFGYVRVRGEISGLKRAASGHYYFDIKDDKALLNSVCWKGAASRLVVQPEAGMEVIASGKVSTYPGRSNYQLVVEALEPAGEGALMAMLEKRKKQLAAEGLFAPERKLRLPQFPNHIGIITSPTGAVIKDMLHRISERWPVQVTLWPVRVQGEGAAEEIAAAIAGFQEVAATPDLLIVARGGGSLEDLWAFNEEVVVRAVAACTIPLISAVGHETDTTLIDYASDYRAPTPTAAAERAVPVRLEWLAGVQDYASRLKRTLLERIRFASTRYEGLARALPSRDRLLADPAQRIDRAYERLHRALPRWVEARDSQLKQATQALIYYAPNRAIERQETRLEHLSPSLARAMHQRLERASQRLTLQASQLRQLDYHQVLKRGFAMVLTSDGAPLTSHAAAAKEAQMRVRFADGELQVNQGAAPVPAKPARQKKPKAASKNDASQVSMFDE